MVKFPIALVLTFTASSLLVLTDAQTLCGTVDFCSSWQVTTSVGGCSPAISVCDDGDETTQSNCEPKSFRCSHVSVDPGTMPVCLSDCKPDCSDKQCGEDGCGGFCGQCEAGSGCSNYSCVSGVAAGTCAEPLPLGYQADDPLIIGTETIIDTETRVTIVTTGDTSQSIHIETPSCNTLTASPEMVFKFTVASGKTFGYDIRTTGYDTVVQLMKDTCGSLGLATDKPEDHIVNCNDDGTPPGDLGSRISGEIGEGTYFVMVDGYSTTDNGPFELITTFVSNCVPLCDGNFCGEDYCGGFCGSCAEGDECNFELNRCFPADCVPQCDTRVCGEDGCGGSCGSCADGTFCLGVSIAADEETGVIPGSSCEFFEVCDNMNPVCEGCTDSQICASNCECINSLEDLPDLVVIEEHMLQETFLHDMDIPPSSCSLVEGCVKEPGLRRLLRFTSSILNQGKADVHFPEPKDRPDLFEFGPCHQHYHFKKFAEYTLFNSDGKTVALQGRKYAYCMEDTVRHFDGSNVACDKKYDCGFQGIQKGWLDSYGWSLDCSWIDITELDAGEYVLEITANPGRVFPEISFENNVGRIRVTIPDIQETVDSPLKLETSEYVATEGGTPTAEPVATGSGVFAFNSFVSAFVSLIAFLFAW